MLCTERNSRFEKLKELLIIINIVMCGLQMLLTKVTFCILQHNNTKARFLVYIENFLYNLHVATFLDHYSENVVLLHSKQKLRVCSKVKIIGHVPYINILAGLRGLRDKLLYLVLLSLYPNLFWELRYKRNFKNLQFWP